jgi:hypothetical protein
MNNEIMHSEKLIPFSFIFNDGYDSMDMLYLLNNY